MKKTILFSLILYSLSLQISTAQNYELNQVTQAEIAMTEDPVFKDIDAIVLQRNVKTLFYKYVEVYEKIKILSNDGLEYGTIEVPYFGVTKLEGATYNLENGLVVKTPLKKDMIFTEKVKMKGRSFSFKKVSLPKVKVGSVIEIHYRATEGTQADIDLQYHIPIKNLKVEMKNSSASTYQAVQNPRAFLEVNRIDDNSVVRLSCSNVPALEKESYVYDIDLYRAYLTFKWIGAGNSKKFGSWEGIANYFNSKDGFMQHTKPKSSYKKEVESLISGVNDPMKKVEKIYNYLKENITWNGEFGISPDLGTRWTFNKKEGDVSDINILMVSMLNSIGLEAYPILASTKMNGVHVTASFEAFNYTLAGMKIANQWYVFDAANPRATFNYLPEYLINGRGMAIKNDGSFGWVDLTSPKVSKTQILVKASLDEDLLLTGNVKARNTGYFGIDLKLQAEDTEVKRDSLIGLNVEGLQFTNINVDVDDKSDVSKMSFDFSMEDAVEFIGDDLHISPLFFLSLSENPFKKETRTHPIDFGYPFTRHYVFNVKLPENYDAEYLPEPIKVSLPNKWGTYLFNISQKGRSLAVVMKFDIKTSMIDKEFYSELREFYKMRMEKENEKVILKLKS